MALEAFSWQQDKINARKKQMARAMSLAHCNPDWIAQHPNLAKELLNDSIKVKVETQKYVDQKVDRSLKYGTVPKPSVIIKRYNR